VVEREVSGEGIFLVRFSQKTLERDMIQFKADPVGILEEEGVVAREPRPFLRGVDDLGAA